MQFGADAVAEAARLIRSGEVVAVPTETVYGLAADATSSDAVDRIYEAKGRPRFNPLIVHVASVDQAREIAEFADSASTLARLYWPGPLTMVLPLRRGHGLSSALLGRNETVALRMSRHPAMEALLAASGTPLAAPSANASGTISPTRAEHVVASLGGRIPLVIDGGPTQAGLESTIVEVGPDRIRLLRPGPLDVHRISAMAKLAMEEPLGLDVGRLRAPGQLASHYAPSKPLRLNAIAAEPDEWMIGFGAVAGDDNLSPSGDLDEAAARLFDALHRSEGEGRPRIAVAPIPNEGIGLAINDRLGRAAAPRDRD
ncbi:MAG TPA: L-threonylcarbamoyladenylate synthase [Allosphingosinicella sp.]|jgi:L-threonylcarbamoyladenylate synthase